MRVKRLITLALAAVAALALAGIAIAHGGGGNPQKTEEVAATFTAAPVADKTRTKTCTGVDGTYTIAKSVDQGDSTGDARLTGKITIRSKTVVNNDTGLGWSEGNVSIADASTGKLKAIAGFTATVNGGSKLEGLALGKVKNPAPAGSSPKAKGGHGRDGKYSSQLIANFSAATAQDGTVTGNVGGGGGDNRAIVHGNPCAKPQPQAAPNDQGGRHGDEHHGDHQGDGGRK
jgi:hypothetical protein